MSFKISKPGMYRMQCGRKAEVMCERDGEWFGRFTGFSGQWVAAKWLSDGTFQGNSQNALIAEWHSPPEPPPGFRMREREYRFTRGDRLYETGLTRWRDPPKLAEGMTAEEMDKRWSDDAPHYIASPIPAPFRISEKGCGVYETRDGREATVTAHTGHIVAGLPLWRGSGTVMPTWRDNGRWTASGDSDRSEDLVRYLRPLAEPEPWVATCELRWHSHAQSLAKCSAVVNGLQLEQKWVCGSEYRWRPLEVAP